MTLIHAVANITDTLLGLILLQRVTHRCSTYKLASLLYFLSNIIVLTALFHFHTPGVLCRLSSLLVTALYCLFLTRSLSHALFLPIVFFLLASLSEGIVITLIQWLLPSSIANTIAIDHLMLESLVVSRLILAAAILAVSRFIPSHFHISRKNWFLLYLISIYLLSISVLIQYDTDHIFNLKHMLPILLIGACIIYCAFFQLGFALDKQSIEKSRLKTELQQNRLKLRQQDEMVSMYQKLLGLQHDYHNHLQILSALAEKNNQQELLAYIQGLSDHLFPNSTAVSTGNVYLDAIINAKYLVAEKNHVGLRLEIQTPDTMAIAPSDLCMLVSNILDNGLEACMNNKELAHRVLNFYMAQQKGFLLISSQNYVEQLPHATRFSSLHNTQSSGYGLHQVKQLTKQYNGYCTIDTDAHMFHIQILLPHAIQYDQLFISQVYPDMTKTTGLSL